MTKKRFTKEEAEALVDRRIRTRVEFSRVPKGTEGVIVKADYMGLYYDDNENIASEYDVVVRWDLPGKPTTVRHGLIGNEPVMLIQSGERLEDWFSKWEYEMYLEEV